MSSSWTLLPVFSGGTSFAKNFLRNVIVLPGFCCLILTLTACGESSSPSRTSAIAPPSVALPPGSEQRALEPGQLGRAMGPDGLPVLDQPKGVNVTTATLFAEDIRDPIDRIKRLENAILEMRRDYDATLPSIKRLVSVEKDMQTLMAQLEMLINNDPNVAAAPLAPVAESSTVSAVPVAPQPAATQPQPNDPLPLVPAVPEARSTQMPPEAIAPLAVSDLSDGPADAPAPPPEPVKTAIPEQAKAQPPPPVAASPPPATPPPKAVPPPEPSALAALGLRLGEDGGKSRLVIDLNGSVVHRTDLDNDEKIVVIEISGAGWNGPAKQNFTSPIIQSYTTQPLESGKGTRVIVTLKKPVKILLDSLLKPEATNKNYRLVIDLKGQ